MIALICSCKFEDKNLLEKLDGCYSLNGQNYNNKEIINKVSIIRLIAYPEQFDNQYITTNGYFLYYGSKKGVLCLLLEDIEKDGANCIYLIFKEEPEEFLEKRYVKLSGIFINEGKFLSTAGTINVDLVEIAQDILIKDSSQRYKKDMRSFHHIAPYKPLFR